LRQAGGRARSNFWLKAFGIPGAIALFFVGYLLLQHFPLFPVTVMPVTALDRWIGFHPWSLVLYFSLWIYISLPPVLLVEKRGLASYLEAAVGLSLVGFLIFLFWPTARPDFAINWANYPGFGFLKTVDLARNACPSLHAAFAIFSALWLGRQLRVIKAPVIVQILSGLWCLGILYSTIATRQHVALDIYAGGALGALAFVVHWQFFSKFLRRPSASPRLAAAASRRNLPNVTGE
jgi:membrane-associated phospholipid phosphatase